MTINITPIDVPLAEHTSYGEGVFSTGNGFEPAKLLEPFFENTHPFASGIDISARAVLPPVEIDFSKSIAPRDFTYESEDGRRDVISAINPVPGETLAQLVKRLHPNLPAERILETVNAVLQYNRDYGNDLANGGNLSSERPVFLTSVKYFDEGGRVNRVESPNGRTSEFAYDAGGKLVRFEISEPGSSIAFERDADGNWSSLQPGQLNLRSAQVDAEGNLSIVGTAGQTRTFLTRGDVVMSMKAGDDGLESTTVRNGNNISQSLTRLAEGVRKDFISYFDSEKKLFELNPDNAREILSRINIVLPREFLTPKSIDKNIDEISYEADLGYERGLVLEQPVSVELPVEETARALVSVAKELGVDPVLALAAGMVESSLLNTAVGDGGESFGVLQLNVNGQLGKLSPAQAFNPYTNARVALSTFALNQSKYTDPGELAAASQRPADPEGYARKVNAAMDDARALLQKISA